ncbi:MAG: hypothetical protein ACRD0U_18165 [Acidimicrobiales bacterium]
MLRRAPHRRPARWRSLGLLTTEKVGRVRRCRLGPHRLEDEVAWMARYQQMLEQRLDSLGQFLERTKGSLS